MNDGNNGGDAGAGAGAGDAGAGAAAGSAADVIGGAAGGDGGAGTAGTGAAAAGGAAAGGDAGAGADGGKAAVDPDWYSQVSADAAEGDTSLRDWLKASNVPDITALAKIARDNQVALRDSGRVKVPGDDAKPEDVAAFHRAIGVPEKADGYEFKAPDGPDGKPLPLNTPLLTRLAEKAAVSGLPKAGFEAVVQDFISMQLDEASAADTKQKQEAAAVVKGWGGEADAKIASVDAAAKALGLTSQDMVALRGSIGANKALNMLATIGAGMGEDNFVDGGKTAFGVDGKSAKSELDRLKGDSDFMAKARTKGSPEAVRWQRLQDAYGAYVDRQASAA